jgi:glycosyltransferase involved in cell wall biosynthesis
MKKISIALAIYNEAETLSQCLESVKDWTDEIIVVDGGSIDDSINIAKQYGAAIIKTDNPPMFHVNKQKAIDACTGDWILQLDADEVVSPELKEEIRGILNSLSINGYWIPRKNYFLGKFLTKGGQYPDFTLRLYRNGKGKLPCKSVHEQAIVDGPVEYLKADLLHYSYPNFEHYLEHFNRYTTIISEEYKKDHIPLSLVSGSQYMLFKPMWWFLLTYFRHRGYVDGFAGFVYSCFSALRFPVSYIKYWEMKRHKGNIYE